MTTIRLTAQQIKERQAIASYYKMRHVTNGSDSTRQMWGANPDKPSHKYDELPMGIQARLWHIEEGDKALWLAFLNRSDTAKAQLFGQAATHFDAAGFTLTARACRAAGEG